jgi:DNA sulfur modification protein DndD
MKISRLAISNFRQYQSVNFDFTGDDSDFIIINGANGNGKTNFLNALSWCLYDSENFAVKDNQNLSLVSRDTISSASESDEITTKVGLDLTMANGTSARVTRIAKFKKKNNVATQISPSKLSVTVLEDAAKGSSSEANPELWIEQNLPKRLEPYVLFDGERLENFFKRESAKTVQAAVLEIAQVDVLRTMNSHLEIAIEKLRKAAASQDSTFSILEASKRVEELNIKLTSLSDEELALSEQLNELDRNYAGIEDAIVREKTHVLDIQREKNLSEQIAALEIDFSEAWAQFAEWGAKNAPAVFARSALEATLGEIEERHQKGELPPPIKESVLVGLLEQGVCVCGSDLNANREQHLHIQDLLDKNRSLGELGGILQGMESHLTGYMSRLQSSEDTRVVLQRQIGALRKKLSELKVEYDALRKRISESASQGKSAPLEDLQRLMDGKDRANLRVGEVRSQMETIKSQLKVAEADQERLLSKSDKAQAQFKKLEFAKEVLKQSQLMFKELSDEVRLEVQKQIDAQFKRMIWKQNYIDRVEIDDDFIVSVWDKQGFEILATLSAGERECLAFAFSLALNGISNYELPMVIDTPFGRMSSEPRPNVARALAESTKPGEGRETRQVILLMTDTEYDTAVKEALESRNPKLLSLQFDQGNSTVSLQGA